MSRSSSDASSSSLRRTLLGTGAVLAGAYAGLQTAVRWRRRSLPAPSTLSPVLDAEARTLEGPDGRANVYVRPGTGVPIVLLHSFNAAASSHEVAPIFDHLATTTDRPLYAMDWLGFGRSARRAIDYTSDVYDRQLYHLLETAVDTPADVVALSLGCEYAARVALQAAPFVRRLVLVAPTGLTAARERPLALRLALEAAGRTGVFELLFARLTRRASLRRFYARQVFVNPTAVPDTLVDAAYDTSHAQGAHRAPRRFVDGSLFLDDVADTVYARLYRPTLLLTPSTPADTVQRFDRLPEVLHANERDLHHTLLPGGLLPHHEAPEAFFDALDEFVRRDS
jgi:pimeloyl-ACP methyl ester carboxylesterase